RSASWTRRQRTRERGAQDLDPGVFDPVADLDDVEAANGVGKPSLSEIRLRGAGDAPLLLERQRFARGTEHRAAPSLDLDEAERLAVAGDEVDLPSSCTVVALEDLVTRLAQMPPGDVLPVLALPPQPSIALAKK